MDFSDCCGIAVAQARATTKVTLDPKLDIAFSNKEFSSKRLERAFSDIFL